MRKELEDLYFAVKRYLINEGREAIKKDLTKEEIIKLRNEFLD